MRVVSVLILFLLFFQSQAEEYTVFEKDGFFGIKNQEGEITTPPVYEHLGWSGGSKQIFKELIGFKKGNSWGLVSVKNKILAEAKYYSVEPFDEGLIKASVKGNFSNQLFYGLLNEAGKTVVSFNYFSLERIGSYLLISQYENIQLFGVVTNSNEWVVPADYKSIRQKGEIFIGKAYSGDLDLYKDTGSTIFRGLDSLKEFIKGYVCYKDGYAGYISKKELTEDDFIYKSIQVNDGDIISVSFPKWGIYRNGELQFEMEADSLHRDRNGLWKTYVNGAHHFTLDDSTTQFKDFFLMDVTEKHYVLKGTKTGKWTVYSKQNEQILQGYDSIVATEYSFWASKDGLWKLFNRLGDKKNRFSYQSVQNGLDGQFIVQLNEHWGVLDPLGFEVTPVKYDLIEQENGFYKVSYLDKTGVVNSNGDWIVGAEYSDVFVYDQLLVGKKNFSYAYYNNNRLLMKRTYKPIKKIGDGVLVSEEGYYGIVGMNGELLVNPEYLEIDWVDGFYVLRNGDYVSMVDEHGREVFGEDAEIQKVLGLSEEYFLVLKNDKFGFLDLEGRLRISNRYDDARVFSEGLAAIKLREKWGFISKNEVLAIQPYYDEISPLSNGLIIVKEGDKYGIIDKIGNSIVNTQWSSIEILSTGNFRVFDSNGNAGLISYNGQFLLRPSFDSLEDHVDKVIVSKNGKKGMLDYLGNQLFNLNYKEIQISGTYTIIKY